MKVHVRLLKPIYIWNCEACMLRCFVNKQSLDTIFLRHRMVKHFGKQLIKLCDNKKVSYINDIDKWSPKLFLEKRFVSSAIFFFIFLNNYYSFNFIIQRGTEIIITKKKQNKFKLSFLFAQNIHIMALYLHSVYIWYQNFLSFLPTLLVS